MSEPLISETAKVADFFALTFFGPVSVGRRSSVGQVASTVAFAFFLAAAFFLGRGRSAFFFSAAVGGVAFSVFVFWPGLGVTTLPSVGEADALAWSWPRRGSGSRWCRRRGVRAPGRRGRADVREGLADGVTGGRVGATTDGGAGSACTAEPALIALPTRAMTMPIATTAAISTASRRTQ